ncbi:hypothetical protein AB832_00590 [Flavobacteriaceae bacterium (ex Bugula neritina AB1)]|nr:hypothetical protein AB832_00590 [Flavobacteriaceae bacterium (ex Bugula neritina AB1)]
MKHPCYITIPIFFLLIMSCSKNHTIPVANIKFVKLEVPEKEHPIIKQYNLYFTSDIPIDSLLLEKGDLPRLYCPLTLVEKKEITIEDLKKNEHHFSGFFEKTDKLPQQEGIYNFVAKMRFYNKDGDKEKYMGRKKILEYIANKNCLISKIEEQFYMNTYTPYLSHAMCIPVKDILKIIE